MASSDINHERRYRPMLAPGRLRSLHGARIATGSAPRR